MGDVVCVGISVCVWVVWVYGCMDGVGVWVSWLCGYMGVWMMWVGFFVSCGGCACGMGVFWVCGHMCV